MKRHAVWGWTLLCLTAPLVSGQTPSGLPVEFTPPPATVVRFEKGYRYPQAGWIALHIEGTPHERGVQHGRLMAPEIVGYLRCFALTLNHKTPEENWRHVRTFANALFLRKFDPEFLEEMQGIADGARAAGARFDGRAIDVVDIMVLNCWSEIEGLEHANAATPTGLEGRKWKSLLPGQPPPRFQRCSAFVAAGPATPDGKIVFSHVTMYELYPAHFSNVWIDVQPSKGRRFVMCSFPGGIQSGMDYYINDAGILISETTLTQTGFNIAGLTCASRIRKAVQYADSIDKAVDYLAKDSNGLYTNEWLLADIHTNEIAMLDLGTQRHKLWRSSKNEWFGDTPGFYWSCNSFKDVDVRMETIASAKARPSKMAWSPSGRDQAWGKLYQKYRGKIGSDFIGEFCASDVLTGPTAFDVKFTSTGLARELRSWASFGPPTGTVRKPTDEEKENYPGIQPLAKSPWTLLAATAPAQDAANLPASSLKVPADKTAPADDASTEIIWRGTLLPQTDGDFWLATAFADYHEVVANEKMRLHKGESAASVAEKLHKELDEFRKQYASAAAKNEVALADVKKSFTSDDWSKLASAKGVLLLHQLRRDLGADAFDRAMDDFGMKHGGQRVTSQQFQQHMESATGRNMTLFFAYWLQAKGLPAEKK